MKQYKVKAFAEYTIIAPGTTPRGIRLKAKLELIPAPVPAGNRNALKFTINDLDETVTIYNVMFDSRFNTITRFRQNADQFVRDLYPDDWKILNDWSWEM